MCRYKTILTIAGSDSIGGAGIQADIKTAMTLGVYSMSAVTAVTAQNSSGVWGIEPVSTEMLDMQLKAVAEDVMPDAVKIGMVPTAEHASVIARWIETYGLGNIVYDPVVCSTSGRRLMSPEALEIVRSRLIPTVTLLTPNLPEAELLSDIEAVAPEDSGEPGGMDRIASCLSAQFGIKGVLVKGGHLPEKKILTDVLAISEGDGIRFFHFPHPRVDTRNSHGTGCTLSSAIASYFALGLPLETAVRNGIDYLQKALISGSTYTFGRSGEHGPVDHSLGHSHCRYS